MTAIPLLAIRDLTVEFATRRGARSRRCARSDVSVAKGETVGIVGESGSGKSVTSYAVMRILDRAGRIAGARSASPASTCGPRPSARCATCAGGRSR